MMKSINDKSMDVPDICVPEPSFSQISPFSFTISSTNLPVGCTLFLRPQHIAGIQVAMISDGCSSCLAGLPCPFCKNQVWSVQYNNSHTSVSREPNSCNNLQCRVNYNLSIGTRVVDIYCKSKYTSISYIHQFHFIHTVYINFIHTLVPFHIYSIHQLHTYISSISYIQYTSISYIHQFHLIHTVYINFIHTLVPFHTYSIHQLHTYISSISYIQYTSILYIHQFHFIHTVYINFIHTLVPFHTYSIHQFHTYSIHQFHTYISSISYIQYTSISFSWKR